MKRPSVIEKAGSPTASANNRNRGTIFLVNIGAALRVHMVNIKRVYEILEISQVYYSTDSTNREPGWRGLVFL